MTQLAADPDASDLNRLIQETRRGAEESLNQICARLRPQLIALCRGRFHGRLRAKTAESDLVQESLLCVSQNFATFRGQTAEELFAWVARILDNKALEFQRRYLAAGKRDITREERLAGENSSEYGVVLETKSATPLEKLISTEDALQVQHVIDQLPEHYQGVVRLRHMEELSFPQIAARLESTEPTVKNIYVRAMKILELAIKRS